MLRPFFANLASLRTRTDNQTAVFPRAIKLALAGLLIISLSCGRRTQLDAGRIMGAVQSTPALTDVTLPMSVRNIGKQRTHAIITEFGVEETLGGVVVRYFGDRGESSEPVSPSANVHLIEATWTLPTDDSAAVVWHRYLRNLSGIADGTAECFVTGPGGQGRRLRIAQWVEGKPRVYLMHRYTDSLHRADQWHLISPEVSISLWL